MGDITDHVAKQIETPKQYRKLEGDIRDQSAKAMRSGEKGQANINLHHIKPAVDQSPAADGEGEAVLTQINKQFRPGSDTVESYSWEYFGFDDLDKFEDYTIDERLDWSSSPFVDQLEMECRRPEENVISEKDQWVFDKQAVRIFEDMIDFQGLANDLDQAHNIPKMDLRKAARQGVGEVKQQKMTVMDTKSDIVEHARDILREVIGPKADNKALHTKTPMGLYNFVDDKVEESDKAMGQDLNVLLEEVQVLKRMRDQTENHSIDTFGEVLDHSGYSFPSSVSQPEDVIVDHGIGSLDYLGI